MAGSEDEFGETREAWDRFATLREELKRRRDALERDSPGTDEFLRAEITHLVCSSKPPARGPRVDRRRPTSRWATTRLREALAKRGETLDARLWARTIAPGWISADDRVPESEWRRLWDEMEARETGPQMGWTPDLSDPESPDAYPDLAVWEREWAEPPRMPAKGHGLAWRAAIAARFKRSVAAAKRWLAR